MRFADGPTVEEAVPVAAPVQRVWALATDVSLPSRFSLELCSARWLDDAGLALGARFEGCNRHLVLGEWRTVCHVTILDPPAAFGWAVVDPDGRFGGGVADPAAPVAWWGFRLAHDGAGTRLLPGARLGPARSGLSLALDRYPGRAEQTVASRLAELSAGIRRTLEGVKALAEAG